MRVKQPPLDIDELARCAEQGVSAQRLAARFGRSLRTIQAVASRNCLRLKGVQQSKDEARRILGTARPRSRQPHRRSGDDAQSVKGESHTG